MPVSTFLSWQGSAGTILMLHELHEDVVPDFEIARAVARRFISAPIGELGAEIEVDLGIGTVRASVADWSPPVVLKLDDPLFRHADEIAPDRVGVVIVGMNGGIETVGRQSHRLGQELP